MEDELWSLSQQCRVLREYRAEIQGVWDDNASREINSRELEPHDEDSQHLVQSFHEQQQSLSHMRNALHTAGQCAVAAREHAIKAARQLHAAQEQIPAAYGEYEQYVRHEAQARGEFDQIEHLVTAANSGCD